MGGVVSVDVVLFRNGELDRSQIEAMKSLREQFKEFEAWREDKSTPPKNIAWKKPSFLRNTEGKRPFVPSISPGNQPRFGNDGDRNTNVGASGANAWTYEVDFMEPVTISKTVVSFGRDRYATAGEMIAVEPQTGREISLGRLTDGKGESWTLTFDPVECTGVKMRLYKPDASDQPGMWMTIAELEAYE